MGSLINPIQDGFSDKLDPQFIDIYNRYQAPHLRADQVTIEEYRANPSKYTRSIAPGPKPEVGTTEIHEVEVDDPKGTIKIKVYTPTEDATQKGGICTDEGHAVHLNFHGGGWVIGGLQSDESWCRIACQDVGMVVVDVDYRLAPEHPFPTQVWDSWAALKWVFANAESLGIDKSRVSIGGLSAGGHLAAVLAHLARDEIGMPPLKLQMLVVPAVDSRWIPLEGSCDPAVPYETYKTLEDVPCLPLDRLKWFSRLWIGTNPEERKKKTNMWICSPILAESHTNLAPCSIHCAEFDILRDEAIAYNDLLNKAGTPSRIKVYDGVCHPFGHWDGELERAKEYVRETCADLKRAHTVNGR